MRLPGAAVLAPIAGAAEGALILATRPERLAAVAAPAPPQAVASPRTAPVLERLRGRLIVSVQAEEGSPLAAPEAIALLAKVAVRNGAAGLRIEGADRIAAVRAATGVPIIGIVKRRHPGFEPYITSTIEEIEEAAGAGADVIAFDATRRDRAGGADTRALIAAVAARGLVAMADCSSLDDARAAAVDGADIVATTLAGYTDETRGRPLPAVDIVSALRGEHPFVVCEGGIGSPADAAAAFGAGASAIVVGRPSPTWTSWSADLPAWCPFTSYPSSVAGHVPLLPLAANVRGFRFFAVGSAVLAYMLAALGSWVRINEAGMSCPDWPLCHGVLVPSMANGVLWEWSHRLIALTARPDDPRGHRDRLAGPRAGRRRGADAGRARCRLHRPSAGQAA